MSQRMNKTLGIVSHDAGGAEILSNWVKKNNKDTQFLFFLRGPAKKIFQRNLDIKLADQSEQTIQNFLNEIDLLMCGTSWQSSLEREFIVKAKQSKIKVISILDHWVNYRERFMVNKTFVLPDEIWVCDEFAYKKAKDEFEGAIIKKIKNYYFESIKKKITVIRKKILPDDSQNILYVCEPISQHAKLKYGDEFYLGYNENTALLFFLKNIKKLNINKKTIVIRPHPAEEIEKYLWVKDYYDGSVEFRGENDLIEEIMRASIVAGCESMAMIVGLMAKKRVISTIPHGGRECVLPFKSIEIMKEIISEND